MPKVPRQLAKALSCQRPEEGPFWAHFGPRASRPPPLGAPPPPPRLVRDPLSPRLASFCLSLVAMVAAKCRVELGDLTRVSPDRPFPTSPTCPAQQPPCLPANPGGLFTLLAFPLTQVSHCFQFPGQAPARGTTDCSFHAGFACQFVSGLQQHNMIVPSLKGSHQRQIFHFSYKWASAGQLDQIKLISNEFLLSCKVLARRALQQTFSRVLCTTKTSLCRLPRCSAHIGDFVVVVLVCGF